MTVNTPIDVFLKNTVQIDIYRKPQRHWKGEIKSTTLFLPNSYISNSGSKYGGGFVLENSTGAQLWTKHKLHFERNSIVYDYRTNRKYSVTGYTHQFHDSYPFNGAYWFTTVSLAYVGGIHAGV